jgi:hypothetical protein
MKIRKGGDELEEYVATEAAQEIKNAEAKLSSLLLGNNGQPSIRKIRAILKDDREYQDTLTNIHKMSMLHSSPETLETLTRTNKIQRAFEEMKMANLYKPNGGDLDAVISLKQEEKQAAIKNSVEPKLASKIAAYTTKTPGRVAMDSLAVNLNEKLSDKSEFKRIKERLESDNLEKLAAHQKSLDTVSPVISSAASAQANTVKGWILSQMPRERTSLSNPAKTQPITLDERRNFAIKTAAALDPIGTIQRASESGSDIHPVALKTIQILYPRIYMQMVSDGTTNPKKVMGSDVGGINMLQGLHTSSPDEEPGTIRGKISAPEQTRIGRISSN